LTELNTN